jgi:CheY-like chemotaxis protein
VLADPTQVHQALLNVATNAVQALGGRAGAVTLAVAARELPPPGLPGARLPAGRYVCATVSDTGPGMSAEVSARIFDPFFTTKAPGQGTGLGLSVVQGIMGNLGGAVTVASVSGQGATFTLWFPEAPRTVLASLTPPPLAPEASAWHRLARRPRVLVVDDESAVAIAAARLLERRGCVVTILGGPGAAEAAARVSTSHVDVAVLDLAMPGLDGLALLAELRRSRSGLPAVIVTGDHAAAEPAILAAAQPVVLLAKPFSAEELERSIGQALDGGPMGPPASPRGGSSHPGT